MDCALSAQSCLHILNLELIIVYSTYEIKYNPMIAHVNDQNFAQEIEQYEGIALVDFFAVWCGPCKQQTPIIEALATKYEGKIKIAKLDVDESGATGEKFSITSIPTLIFFKNGKQVGEALMGLRQPAELERTITELLQAK